MPKMPKHQPAACLLIQKLLDGYYATRGGVTALAKDLHVSRVSIYRWKQGKGCRYLSRLMNIAEQTGLSKQEFGGRIDAAKSPSFDARELVEKVF